MSASDELAELAARTEGHTRGPWEIRADHGEPPAVWHDSETAFSIGRCADCGVEAIYAPADAELIAAAPKLLAALEAVRELAASAPRMVTFTGATVSGIVVADDVLKAIEEALA